MDSSKEQVCTIWAKSDYLQVYRLPQSFGLDLVKKSSPSVPCALKIKKSKKSEKNTTRYFTRKECTKLGWLLQQWISVENAD